MHAQQLLHKHLKKECPKIHNYRMTSLFLACKSLFNGQRLSVTQLGRNLKDKAKPRSRVKRFDRLLSNVSLQNERNDLYSALTKLIINESSQPWLHIDWSCISSVTNLYLLRASLSVKGRAISIYEEVHNKSQENHHPTHVKFLQNLKTILPDRVKPIIVTDAGYRGIWFKAVLEMNWDFVGRLRNKNAVKLKDTNWQLSKGLYELATSKPQGLGHGELTKVNKVPCNFICYKAPSKNRVSLNKYKNKSSSGNSKKYAKGNREPWLLVTSLTMAAIGIVRIYKQRMQIEENFRDTKSWRFGFGLDHSRTRDAARMSILLTINMIAAFLCWIVGILTKMCGKASDFQVQSAKFTNAISVVFLGKEVLKEPFKISKKLFFEAVREIQNIIDNQAEAPL